MTDAEKILQMTNDGLDVFRHYLGDDVNTLHSFRNPYREDSNASCHLYYHQQRYGGSNRYYLHDFGDSSFHGDCFWFVGNICNLDAKNDFQEILRTIDRDLGLYALSPSTQNQIQYRPKVQPVVKPVIDKKNLKFWCTPREMTAMDMNYWSRYGITKDILKKYDVISLQRYTSEKSSHLLGEKNTFNIFPTKESPLFGYQFKEAGGIKIYHPNSKVRFLYGGHLPDPYIFGKSQLNNSPFKKDVVYITGGEKDVLSLASHGFDAVSFNSETYRLEQADIQSLLSKYNYVGVLYDSDETGIRESQNTVDRFSSLPVFRIQLPLAGTKKEKDISDFFATGHTSVELKQLTTEALNTSKKKAYKYFHSTEIVSEPFSQYNSQKNMDKDIKDLPLHLVGVVGTYSKLSSLSHQLKRNIPASISSAAIKMEKSVKALPNYQRGILIPIPSHEGYATYTLGLAKQLSEKLDVPYLDILKSNPRDMLYSVKKENGDTDRMSLNFFKDGAVPSERIPILVDNVIDTGTTLSAAIATLGDPRAMAAMLSYTKNSSNNDNNRFLMLKYQKDMLWNYKRIQMDILNQKCPLDINGDRISRQLRNISSFSEICQKEGIMSTANNIVKVFAAEPITDGTNIYTSIDLIPTNKEKEIYSQDMYLDDIVWQSSQSGVVAAITEKYKRIDEPSLKETNIVLENGTVIKDAVPSYDIDNTQITNKENMDKKTENEKYIGRTYKDANPDVGTVYTIDKLLKGENGLADRFALSGTKIDGEKFNVTDNADLIISEIKEGKHIPVIGQIDFSNGSASYTSAYTDQEEYFKTVKDCIYDGEHIKYRTLTANPALRKKLDDLIYGESGLDNPNDLKFYEQKFGKEYEMEQQIQQTQNNKEMENQKQMKSDEKLKSDAKLQEQEKQKKQAAEENKKKDGQEFNIAGVTAQTALLLGALDAAKKSDIGLFANGNIKSAPAFVGKGTDISPFNALLMALHSDSNEYRTNQYITFQSAKDSGTSVLGHEKSAPFNWVAWDSYTNIFDKTEHLDMQQYKELSPEDKEMYKISPRIETRPIFNIDQTVMQFSDKDAYAKLVKDAGFTSQEEVHKSEMSKRFQTYKDRYPDAIILFRDGDNYRAFNDDASKISNFIGRSPESYLNQDKVKTVGFPRADLDSILPKIINSGSRVAIEDLQDNSKISQNIVDKKKLEAFDNFTRSMNENLVLIKNQPIGTGNITEYSPKEDVVYKASSDNFYLKAHDIVKAVVAATGSSERLNRRTENVISPEDAQRHEQLVQELASASKLVQMGLPATISLSNKKDIDYWKREITEDPNLLSRLEREINTSVKVINNSEKGLSVDYSKLRGGVSSEIKHPNDYSISRGIAKYPDMATKEFILVRIPSEQKADVILPSGASLDVQNEIPQMSKQRIAIALKKEGFSPENIKFYNAGGALGYYKPDMQFKDNIVSLNKLKQYNIVEQGKIDLTEALSRSEKNIVPIDKTSMLKDDSGKWVLYVKPKDSKGIVAIPSREDTGRYFSSLKEDRGVEIRKELGQKYYSLFQKHDNLRSNILDIDTHDLDLSKINKVNVFKTKDNKILLSAVIDGKQQPAQSVSKAQWNRMWIADDINEYKTKLAGNMFRNILGKDEQKSAENSHTQNIKSADDSQQESENEDNHRGFHI